MWKPKPKTTLNNFIILRISYSLAIFISTLFLIFVSNISGLFPSLILLISSIPFFYEISRLLKNQNPTNHQFKYKLKLIKNIKYIPLFIIIILFFSSPFYLTPFLIKDMENFDQNEKTNHNLKELSTEIISNYTDDFNKTITILKWFDKGTGNIDNILDNPNLLQIYPLHIYMNKPYFCIRLDGHNNSKWILKSRCGACEEYSMFFMQIADLSNLTVRSIHDRGYDHNWDEVLINGEWIVVDSSIVNLEDNQTGFNISQGYYDNNWGRLGVTYVYAIYPNGTIEDVTYRYTNLSNLTIITFDEAKNPIPNVNVRILSNNNRKNVDTDLILITNSEGKINLKIGGGSYTIISKINNNNTNFFNKTTISVVENENISYPIILKNDYFWWIQHIPNRLISIISIIAYSFILWFFIVQYLEIKNID